MKYLWQLAGRAVFWLGWPVLWLYLGGTRRTRVIITAGDEVLLVKAWIGSGQWGLPGGGMHRGEDPLQTAIREVREEVDINLEAADCQSLGEITAREYGFKFRVSVYKVVLPEPVDVRKQMVEVAEACWLPKSNLQDLSPLTKRLLADWL